MKRLLQLLIISLLPVIVFSQTLEEKQTIRKDYNIELLNGLAKSLHSKAETEKTKALELAKQNGWRIKYEEDGRFYELMKVSKEGTPIYYTTFNVNAAKSTRANTLHNSGILGLNVEGQNMEAHVWDGGLARTTHQEYDGLGGSNRFSIGDGTTALHYHSAHVTGTIIASGYVANAKGMAPQADAVGYDWNNDDAEATTAAGNGMLLSNHSYGYDATLIPDYYFGAYIIASRDWDVIMYNAPYYLMVASAGNDGNDNSSNGSPLDGNSFYDKLSYLSTVKNNLVVASAQDANIDASGNLVSVNIDSFSSEGPCDDYRIKPDITGNGNNLYSTYESSDNAYNSISGTSMASPNVTGTLLLLQQHYNNLNSGFMRAATLKGLALHTADDAGPAGPDAVWGWGLLNAKEAANVITNNGGTSIINELALSQGSSYSTNVVSDGTNDLIASISWTDPAGTANTGTINDPTPVLVNDIDIRVTQGGSTYYPYRLVNITTNGTGDNDVDPYEKIIISGASGTYTITVTHKGTLSSAPQAYSLIISGLDNSVPPVSDFTVDNLYPANSSDWANFNDLSTNGPTSWLWTITPASHSYVGSTSNTSQNPTVSFTQPGAYTVSLTASNSFGTGSTETKTDYIHVGQPGLWMGATSTDWNTNTNWENHEVPLSSTNVSITPIAINWPTKTGNLTIGTDCNSLNMASGYTELTVIGDLTIAVGKSFTVDPSGIPDIKVGGNWINNGTFTPGQSTVEFNGTSTSTISIAGPSTGGGKFDISGGGGYYGIATYIVFDCYTNFNLISAKVYANGAGNRTFYWANSGGTVQQQITINVPSGESRVNLNFNITPGTNHRLGVSSSSPNLFRNNSGVLYPYPIGSAGSVINSAAGTAYYYFCYDLEYSTGSGIEVFNNLSIGKTNSLVSTNSDVDILQNFTIKPDAYFTNSSGNTFNVMGNAWLMADPSGMASYIDNGTTSVAGTTNVEQYITSQRWHLVSPPVSGATINVYYDVYLKEYNEPTDTWTYLVQPTTIPINVPQGYSAWASNSYTGTTTVTYTGTLNNNDFVLSNLDYTPAAAMTGFNLLGNPYPCALDWNNSWSMSNMSGWMVIYDNGTFRGIHTDGTSYNGKTDGIIPSTQGFWVRALNTSASITIPTSERVHNGQVFYKETKEIIHPMVRLETEINGYSDETVIIFHPDATAGFDGYYDLAKFENVEEAPQIYTMTADGNYAVNFYEPDYQEKIIPVGFQTAEEGLYFINASTISNFNGDIGIYLEDLKTGTITKLSDSPQYEFTYIPMDEEHRFNLHFTTDNLGIEEISLSGLKIYSFGQTVYVKNPDQLPGTIVIYDVMGQVITTGKTVSTLTEIPITQGLGYYFVKVQTGTGLKIEKVFIK